MSAFERRGGMERDAAGGKEYERGADSERNTYRTPADPLSPYTVSSMLALYTCIVL